MHTGREDNDKLATEDVPRENSLSERRLIPSNKNMIHFYKNVNFLNLPLKVPVKPSRPFYVNQRPTPYSLLSLIRSHVEDQQEFLEVVMGHELVFNGLSVRKRINI